MRQDFYHPQYPDVNGTFGADIHWSGRNMGRPKPPQKELFPADLHWSGNQPDTFSEIKIPGLPPELQNLAEDTIRLNIEVIGDKAKREMSRIVLLCDELSEEQLRSRLLEVRDRMKLLRSLADTLL